MTVTRALTTRIDLEGWQTLVALAETPSITAAAELLGVPRATLSRRLSRLEAELGARLVHRTTRRMLFTPAGEALADRARAALESLANAEDAARNADETPRGRLRIAIAPGLAWLITRMLAQLLEDWPELSVELVAGTRAVDLVAEGFDLALRAGDPGDPNLVGRPLARMRLLCFASPALLAQHPPITSPAQLTSLPAVVNLDRNDRPIARWPLLGGGEVAVRHRYACNDMDACLAATVAGVGVALLPEQIAAIDLDAGRLAPVLPGVIGREGGLWLLYPERALLDPKVRVFVERVGPWLQTLASQGALARTMRRSEPCEEAKGCAP